MTYLPQRIAVTGGAGFIGSNFIQYMLKHYPEIHISNIDKLTYAGNLANLSFVTKDKRYLFFQTDIVSTIEVEMILRANNIDTIVHFAAESHVDRSIVNPDDFIRTNIVGTYSLLEAARKVWLKESYRNAKNCRFHHISTDEVYGSLQKSSVPFTENTPYSPRSPYSASKASSDHLVLAYHHTYGLPVTLSNCSNNYGPHQHIEKLIPTIILSCLKRKPIPIYNDGSNIRDWLFVEDHCRAIDVIIRQGKIGETYNIGADTEYSNLSLTHLIFELLSDITGKPLNFYLDLITFVKDRPGHDFRYAIDSRKIKAQLGWHAKYQFRDGLRSTIRWYLEKNLINAEQNMVV